jgi:mannosyltransferase
MDATRRGARWATWAVPGLVMLALGLWGLDRGSMWQDEEVTLEVSRRTLGQILAMIHHVDAVHAAYYLGMHVWMLPGGGEVWLRVPSLLASTASAGLVAVLGTWLGGRGVGLIAGLLFCAAPLVSFYAQEGRSYALVTTAVLAGTCCLVRAVRGGSRGWWIGYAVAMVAAVVLHEFAVLALAAHGLTLLLGRAPAGVWWRWAAGAAACGLAVLPLALASAAQSGQVAWLRRPTAGTVWTLAELFLGSTPAVLVPVAVLVAVGLATRTGPGTPGLAAVAGPLLLLPPALLLLVSQVRPLYHERYVLYALAGVPLLAAQGLQWLCGRVTWPHARVWVPAVVVLAVVAGQLGQQLHVRTVASRSNDLAGAAAVVRHGARPGDGVLFLPSRYRAAALGYPDAFVAVHDVALAQTPVQAANLRGVDKSRRQTRKALLASSRVWVVGRPGLVVQPDEPGAVSARTTLRAHFRRVQAWPVPGMEVALYVRTSP